jgi:trimeric autotransporter adhesin
LDPTLVGAEPDNWGLQYLTVPAGAPPGVLSPGGTKFADQYNMHLYPMYTTGASSIDPTRGDAFVDQLSGDFVTTYAHGSAGSTLAQATASNRGITEFGYPAVGGSPGSVNVDIPTQGKNILSGLMNAWTEGYVALCIYTFYEQGDGFGLLNGPGNPKLSATYMHNFTTPLKDAGATAKTFATGSLTYALNGLPSTGKSLLFQKSNGHYELIIWNNVTNWNSSAGSPITIGPTNVTVIFGATQTTINTYNPTVGSTPIATASSTTSVVIALADYPIIVEAIP